MISPESVWYWAKLGSKTWPEEYHPVICHLIDVGQAAHALWQQVFRKLLRERISNQLGQTNSEGAVGRWIAFWIGAHDIGKLTPCFQNLEDKRTAALKSLLEKDGFSFPIGYKHHSETGTKILDDELASGSDFRPTISPELAGKIAVTVGGHHGNFPPIDWREFTESVTGNHKWKDARRLLLGQLARLFCLKELPVPKLRAGDNQWLWMHLAGLTSVADWIGSNTEFFPPEGNKNTPDTPFDIDRYFLNSGQKAKRALSELGWLGRAEPSGSVVSFSNATGIPTPRDLQTKIVQVAKDMVETGKPRLIIVEAPMGEGKTEAAWYVADCWDQCGGAGSYVALPTMATSNQMFDRVGNFLKTGAGKKNLMLQHGKASLNEQFGRLKFAARIYDEDKKPNKVVAEGWFAANKKHGLLAPYGVGTIDQALLAILQTKHVFVRLFGLAGKCVILDEVHAYDAYMTTLMERLLEWLAAIGCPVVLLSATLPREKRLQLLRSYAGSNIQEPEETIYPRMTTAAIGSRPTVCHIVADPARSKEVHLDLIGEQELLGKLKHALANGGCAAVIRNTVGLAQETYKTLRDGLNEEGITVELFHARFPFGKRKTIEDAVLKRFGKEGGPAERDKRVLVATQVIEQSLDLDFDMMVSDVAPADLILQRAGRLHRHNRGKRPSGVEKPRLWLIKPAEEKDNVPDFGKSEYVYARYILLRSYIALGKPQSVALPGNLERLVEQIYGQEPLEIPELYQDALKLSEKEMREEQRVQRRTAKGVMIPRPEAEDLLTQQSVQLQEDDPGAHRKIQAATRDTEPTIQLIVIYSRDDKEYLDSGCTDLFDASQLPDMARVCRLLDNEVTLSHAGCVFHYIKQPVPKGWKKSGILRHHRIIRIKPDGASLTDEWIRLDPDLGVVISRKSNTEEEQWRRST